MNLAYPFLQLPCDVCENIEREFSRESIEIKRPSIPFDMQAAEMKFDKVCQDPTVSIKSYRLLTERAREKVTNRSERIRQQYRWTRVIDAMGTRWEHHTVQ